jgi:hypothetical protein
MAIKAQLKGIASLFAVGLLLALWLAISTIRPANLAARSAECPTAHTSSTASDCVDRHTVDIARANRAGTPASNDHTYPSLI